MSKPQAETDSYDGYEAWKGWSAGFTYDAGDALSFSRELNDPDFKGKAVLELGFGEGRLLAWLRDQGARVVGTEINERLLDAAKEAGSRYTARIYRNCRSSRGPGST
jgi:2-polyprenyl-3-methyl-5-hydroxy-6-metoxy-1,4-benzoquinol methylase